MIDIEYLVFDTLFNAVTAVRNDVNITKGYVEETAEYPCLVVREVDNVPYQRTDTDDCAENYSRVTYQVEAFSDKQGTAMSECKELLKLADAAMQGMKFRRIHKSEPFNVNRSIFRQYTRYAVIVRDGITEGEDTIYQMYRR